MEQWPGPDRSPGAAPSYLSVFWRLSNSHPLDEVCDDDARHDDNGFWPKHQEPIRPRPWRRRVAVPADEDPDASTDRLEGWIDDPDSPPDIEQWYQGTARPLLERPLPTFAGGAGAGDGGISRGGGRALSHHPVDQMIRKLVETNRDVTSDEVQEIMDHIATAPFSSDTVRVRVDERGASYQGSTLGARADSMTYHLVKRVALERQWAEETTAEHYLDDLHRAAHHTSAQLAVFARRGGYLAAVVSPTHEIIPLERRGARSLPNLLVVYATDRGIIISGYQFSDLDEVGIPKEARWLK